MSQNKLIIGGVVLTLLIVVGSYFIVFPPGKSSSQATVLSYSTNDKERPKIEIKSTSFDLGAVKVSEQKSAVFTVKNVGKKPLQFTDISSSCMCTFGQIVVDGKKSPEFGMHAQGDYSGAVDSGKTAQVRVIYRPYEMPVYGPVEREVYMSTNDPENPKLTFKVTANVK